MTAPTDDFRQGATEPRPIVMPSFPESTHIYAVASGKGGVGKSTVTVNLAVALAQEGKQVGLVDADIWGFSVPRMLGLSGKPELRDGHIQPLENHGLKVISIGFFLPEESPVIWRGPLLHRALEQFLSDVEWGPLDFLLLDLPPGTGDVSISLAKLLPDTSLILVTTPQTVASKVAQRAARLAEEAHLDIAGVVENMSSFTCPDCGSQHFLFGEGGGRELASSLNVPLMGEIPLLEAVREQGDRGEPVVLTQPDSEIASSFRRIARAVIERPVVEVPADSTEQQAP